MKTTLKLMKVLSCVLLIAVLSLAVMLVGVRLLGLEIYTILSPSMEPNYPTGSIIYVKKADPADLQVRDVITFQLTDSMTATHRIVEILPAQDGRELSFRTKGDNNDEADTTPVYASDVIGRPIMTIPLLGYVAVFIQQPPGLYLTIAGCLIILFLIVITDMLSDDKTAITLNTIPENRVVIYDGKEEKP